MENTIISHELEEMRSQIGILKEKLEKQNIVNDRYIRQSMKSKTNDLNRIVRGTLAGGIFALIYCPICFSWLGCSLPFVIVTTIILAVCLIVTIQQKIVLGRIDFSQGSLIEIAETLGRVRKHYIRWQTVVAPVIIIPFFTWCIYEFNKLDNAGGIVLVIGATVGGIIGGLVGFSINRKVIRKTDDLLAQIEELQKDGTEIQ